MHLIDLCRLRAIPSHAESQSAGRSAEAAALSSNEGEAKCLRMVEAAGTTLTGV